MSKMTLEERRERRAARRAAGDPGRLPLEYRRARRERLKNARAVGRLAREQNAEIVAENEATRVWEGAGKDLRRRHGWR